MRTRVDLTADQLVVLHEVLRAHGVSEVHRPVIFGSRVRGDSRRYSDLDLALTGASCDPGVLRDLRAALEESRLPFRVDVVDLESASEGLRGEILDHGLPLSSIVTE